LAILNKNRKTNTIINEELTNYEKWLKDNEKSSNTRKRYISILKKFVAWTGERKITKSLALDYKEKVADQYKPAGINLIIAALNSLFQYKELPDLTLKYIKMQNQPHESLLNRAEYNVLLRTAQKKHHWQIYYILQTLAATGIRIGELPYITVEAIHLGYAKIYNKGKSRRVYLPQKLQFNLQRYIADQTRHIHTGTIFRSSRGNVINQNAQVGPELKKLAQESHIDPNKVKPHALRSLFAREYYNQFLDLVELADILGHSRLDTTRRYVRDSQDTYHTRLDRLNIVPHQKNQNLRKFKKNNLKKPSYIGFF
jgi:integrase